MITDKEVRAHLHLIVDHWFKYGIEKWADKNNWMDSFDPKLDSTTRKKMKRAGPALGRRMAKRARKHIGAFLEDNRGKSAKELEDLAQHLSPGGAHNGGDLVRLIHANILFADSLLIAATIRYNWHGGKAGFQFLPDPAETDHEEYVDQVTTLHEALIMGTDGDPRRILTGEDLAFFESLPERFTVYRGCSGVSSELAGEGLCWTVEREVAEWFANRSSAIDKEGPVVVTAKLLKSEICFVKATESEVICAPRRSRQIKCHHRKPAWRPKSWITEKNAAHVH